MRFIISRHGKTDFNAQKVVAGSSDKARLIDEGVEHSKNLANFILHENIEAIYSSPLTRARDTAQPAADLKGLSVDVDDRLKEMDFGVADEKDETNPDIKKILAARFDDLDKAIEGGESYNSVYERVCSCIEDIQSKNYDYVLIVAHLGINRAILARFTKTNIKELKDFDGCNDVVYTIDTETNNCKWHNLRTGETGSGLKMK